VYPARHVGRHIAPLGSDAVQLPTAPLAGAALASQESGLHTVGVNTPAKHVDGPDTV